MILMGLRPCWPSTLAPGSDRIGVLVVLRKEVLFCSEQEEVKQSGRV